MNVELLRPLWVSSVNFLGDCVRRVLHVGPRWKMHMRLARRLVDEQSWGAIPLVSGTQSPIFDAIAYLVKIRDRESIPRLERLFEEYIKSTTTVHQERLHGFTVTHEWGPQDYMPISVQLHAAKALFALYRHWDGDAAAFVTRMLAADNLWRLSEHTIRALLAHAISTRLEVDGHLLARAFVHVNAIAVEQRKSSDTLLNR